MTTEQKYKTLAGMRRNMVKRSEKVKVGHFGWRGPHNGERRGYE